MSCSESGRVSGLLERVGWSRRDMRDRHRQGAASEYVCDGRHGERRGNGGRTVTVETK